MIAQTVTVSNSITPTVLINVLIHLNLARLFHRNYFFLNKPTYYIDNLKFSAFFFIIEKTYYKTVPFILKLFNENIKTLLFPIKFNKNT